MNTSDCREHPLIKVTRSSALWALSTGVVTLGGLSLFLIYVGTLPIKFSVLASTIVAFLAVRNSRVYPFGGLFSNRTQTHLKDPILRPLAVALEEQKKRYLPPVSILWLMIQSSFGILGFLDPPRLTSVLEKGGHVFDLLAPWPRLQLLIDWLFIGGSAGFLGLFGTVYVFTLSFHFLALWNSSGSGNKTV